MKNAGEVLRVERILSLADRLERGESVVAPPEDIRSAEVLVARRKAAADPFDGL